MWLGRIAFLALGILLGWLGTTLSQDPGRVIPEPLDHDAMYQATYEALEHPDFTERTVQVVYLLDQVTDENVEGMFQALDDRVQWSREQETRLIVREMARRDPEDTFERVMQWPVNRSARGAQVAVFEWARVNPVAAREAALKVSDGDKAKEGAMRGLVYGWAYGRKPGLSEYIRSLPEERGGTNKMEFAVIQAAEILRHEGGQAVVEWALEQAQNEDLDWATLAVGQSMNALSVKEPELAAGFLEQYSNEPWASDGPRWLADSWAARDPEAAMAWLKTFPSGQAQIRGMYYAWKSWDRGAPTQANAWLATAEAGPYLDGALAALADSIKRKDPPRAMAAALDIENPEFRRATQSSILQFWLSVQRPNAEAWLAQHPLPEEIVARARDKSRGKRNIMQMLAEQEEELLNQ